MKVCITVDMDNYREYRQLIDPDSVDPGTSFYGDAVPRFLDAFDRHGARATFFVVGLDALDPSHKKTLREIHARGHEIGNHSWSHPYNLRSLSRSEKESEIVRAQEVIADVIGERPVGFRCPSGELDREVLEILDERGYLYDSTIFPSPVMWLFMIYGKIFVRHANYQLGELTAAFAPDRPYLPTAARIHRERNSPKHPGPRVVEIPISAVPWIGLPFYGTLFRMFRPGVFDAFVNVHRRRRDVLNMIYHLIDLADLSGSSLEDAIRRSPGLGISFERRERFVDQSLESLVRAGNAVPLREVAQAHLEEKGLAPRVAAAPANAREPSVG